MSSNWGFVLQLTLGLNTPWFVFVFVFVFVNIWDEGSPNKKIKKKLFELFRPRVNCGAKAQFELIKCSTETP